MCSSVYESSGIIQLIYTWLLFQTNEVRFSSIVFYVGFMATIRKKSIKLVNYYYIFQNIAPVLWSTVFFRNKTCKKLNNFVTNHAVYNMLEIIYICIT